MSDSKRKRDPTDLTIVEHHTEMMAACSAGNRTEVIALLQNATATDSSGLTRRMLASQQDPVSGQSPLMVASIAGHIDIVRLLLDEGAPWNALDRYGKCAGNYATEHEHWEIVNLLVEHGTKAELVLGASIRLERQMQNSQGAAGNIMNTDETSTKPDYVNQNVRYDAAGTLLLDNDNDAVMMEWERPLMEAHASFLAGNAVSGDNTTKDCKKRVLNVGFGLGIIDSAIQNYNPSLHVIIEAHPIVYKKMLDDGWDRKENVRICFGRWQDELPKLIAEGIVFDGMFYDTYGEVRIVWLWIWRE